jgi:cytochrome bd-type quinol oxidase subunit 1
MLSLLAKRELNAFVPGVKDIIEGGYVQKDGTVALSAAEKIERGKKAIAALASYRSAKKEGNTATADSAYVTLQENMAYFGYGYIKDVHHLVPNVPITFYAFRIMVMLGFYFILFFCRGVVPGLQRQACRNEMDALDCFADYSAGLHSRRSRLGSCRMRSSTVGYSRFAAYIGFRVAR